MATSGTLPIPEGVLFWAHTPASTPSTKPPLVFSHAGVATHAMWDAQVAHFSGLGHACLTYDRFGFGRSRGSAAWLAATPRPPPDHDAHLLALIEHRLAATRPVLVGLSMGGGQVLQFLASHRGRALGAASLAGGVPGFDHPNQPAEDALFERADACLKAKDAQGAARLQVRIWGDGPLAEEGRFERRVPEAARRMAAWNVDIAESEIRGDGGGEMDMVPGRPRLLECLGEIDVPVAVAYGSFDETNTTEAMKLVARSVKGAAVREFATGHMINLEMPDEVNQWLQEWLGANFE